jgi:hypothetical protein
LKRNIVPWEHRRSLSDRIADYVLVLRRQWYSCM